MTFLVAAPDTVVRFLGGLAVIHNARSPGPPIKSRDPAVLEVLLHFATPSDAAEARARIPENRRAGFDRLLQALVHSGVLIDADTTAAGPAYERLALVQQQLALLAESAAEIAADVAALGPAALGKPGDSGDLAIDRQLESVIGGVGAVRQSLAQARDARLEEQLRALRARGVLDDLKLHVGAGTSHLPGWVNIDVHPAELSININRGLPFADASARLIYASHMFEHLYYPGEALRFLAECRRVLRPGGRLRLVVPDMEAYIRAYAESDDSFFEHRRRTWTNLPEGRTHLEEFLAYAGAGPGPASFLESHKYGYDYQTLAKALTAVGFTGVVRSRCMESELPELRVDDASYVADAQSEGRFYSLFVEALAPLTGPADGSSA